MVDIWVRVTTFESLPSVVDGICHRNLSSTQATKVNYENRVETKKTSLAVFLLLLFLRLL